MLGLSCPPPSSATELFSRAERANQAFLDTCDADIAGNASGVKCLSIGMPEQLMVLGLLFLRGALGFLSCGVHGLF